MMNQVRGNDYKKPRWVRREGGFSTVALILVIVFFLILPAALFAFETARASLLQVELQNVTDSSALGGTAFLAGGATLQGSTDTITSNQYQTMNAAYQFFATNQLLDVPLVFPSGLPNGSLGLWSNTGNAPGSVAAQAYPATYSSNPQLHCANLTYTLLDQSNAPQPVGSSTAVSLEVGSTWTERTIFVGYFLPILSTFTMSAVSFGGLPQLDLILCFDVSGSMDDGTNVAIVDRYYDPNNGNPRMCYYVVAPSGTTTIAPLTGTGGGCVPNNGDSLFNVMNCINDTPITGTLANASEPQCLSVLTSGGVHPFNFQSGLRTLAPASNGTYSPGSNGGLTAETGLPPGNYVSLTPLLGFYPSLAHLELPTGNSVIPPGTPGTQVGPYDFTDMVVLLPTITVAAPGLYPGTFNFQSGGLSQAVVTCVEASRGNLETALMLKNATVNLNSFAIFGNVSGAAAKPTVQQGSYAAYWYGVRQYAFPMSSAVTAASNFIQTMNLSTNLHISLMAFAGDPPSNNPTTNAAWTGDQFGGGTGSSTNNVDFNVPGFATNYTFGGRYGTPAAQTPTIVGSQEAGFPLPCMPLSQTTTNSTQIAEALLTGNTTGTIDPLGQCFVATGGTDMGDAITEAFTILASSGARPTAKQAIVLFSDGIPSAGSSDPIAATTTGHASYPNIPVYTIGLSLALPPSAFNTQQGAILGDGQTQDCNGATSGMGVASVTTNLGSHAYFVPATATPSATETALNSAFQQIAKSLVVLQQN